MTQRRDRPWLLFVAVLACCLLVALLVQQLGQGQERRRREQERLGRAQPHLDAARAYLSAGRNALAEVALAEARRAGQQLPELYHLEQRLVLQALMDPLSQPEAGVYTRAEHLAIVGQKGGLSEAPPPAELHAVLARTALRRGDMEAAERSARAALAAAEGLAQARFLLGEALRRQGKSDAARAAYEAAVRADPKHYLARLQVAALRLEDPKPDLDAVAGQLRSLLEERDAPVAQFYLGVALNRAGKHAEALPHLQAARSLEPQMPEVGTHLGYALLRTGEMGEARAMLARAWQRTKDVTALYSLGLTYTHAKELPQRVAILEQVVQRAPKLSEAVLALSVAYQAAGQLAGAQAGYQRFVEQEGSNPAAAEQVAAAQARLKELSAAATAGKKPGRRR